jgi:hypothetical protein
MGQRPTRTCALCHGVRLLCDGHFLPKALYRYIRRMSLGDSTNRNPVFINGNLEKQLPSQASEYLLCDACEKCLRTNGETWVLEHCYRGRGSFTLHDILSKHRPFARMEDFMGFDVSAMVEIDASKSAYFAVSVFWRSAVYDWHLGKIHLGSIALGKYEEPFRQYLRGEAALPENAVISVGVAESKECLPAVLFPTSKKNPFYHHHWFRIPGIAFHLYVGNGMDQPLRNGCLVRSQVLYMSNLIDQKVLEDLERAITLRRGR